MKIEIEIPDIEVSEAIRRGGVNALNSQSMKTKIMAIQEQKIAEIIASLDVSKLVRLQIDEVMRHVIKSGVEGRIRAIIRPIVEQEIAKLQAEAAITKAQR